MIEAMADPTPEGGGPSPKDIGAEGEESPEGNPRTIERRSLEAGLVVTSTLMSEHRKRLVDDKGRLKPPSTPEEHALHIAHELLTGENDGDKPFTRGFRKATGEAHDIMMPGFKKEDRGDTLRVFADGEIRVAGIAGVTPDGKLLCYFEDKDGNVVADSGGEDENGDTRFKIPLDREDLLGLQMQAEIDTYSKLFPGQSQEVFQAVMKNRDMDESLDPAIETTAQAAGLPPAEYIRNLITTSSPEAANRPPEMQQLLDSLAGKVLLTKEDFQQVTQALGGSEVLSNRANALSVEIGQLRKVLENDPDNAVAQQKLAALKSEQAVIGVAYEQFKAAQARGEMPFDEYYDKAINGQLTLEQKQMMESFLKGDLTPLADYIQKAQNLTDSEKNELSDYIKKTGKSAGLLLALILVLPAAAAAGVVYMGYGAMSGAGRR
jgi:hypothetical protein